VSKDWIAKFKSKLDQGWDKQREITLANQKQLGIVPAEAPTAAADRPPATVAATPHPSRATRIAQTIRNVSSHAAAAANASGADPKDVPIEAQYCVGACNIVTPYFRNFV
jgi:hypothetical protein